MNTSAATPIPFPWRRSASPGMLLLCLLLAPFAFLRAEEPPGPLPSASAQPAPPPEITHLGQVFVLAQHREDKAVETDEFIPKGETLPEWSQLLTIQRLRLSRQSSPEAMLSHLSRAMKVDLRAQFSVLRQGRHAAVFTAAIPAGDKTGEQRLVGIVRMDTDLPGTMNVLQFALAQTRVEASVVDLVMESWQAKFLRQADTCNRTGGSGE